MHNPVTNFISAHWNGQLKRQRQYWINLFAPFVIMQTALLFSHEIIDGLANQLTIIVYTCIILLWLLISIFVLTWQTRGTLKYAPHAPVTGILLKSTTMIYAALYAAQILFHLPSTFHYLQISLAKDQVSKNAADIRVIGSSLLITGAIDFELPQRVLKHLTKHPNIKTISLESTGGYLPPARKLAQIITSRNLNTHTNTTCQSACTIIFLSGHIRTVSPDTKLGFHTPHMIGMPQILLNRQIKQDIDTLRKKHIPEGFIRQIYSTPNNQLWFPDHKELIKAGYITHINGRSVQ